MKGRCLELFRNITTELILKNNTRQMSLITVYALGSKRFPLSEVLWPV
jgi:hypothetical protein